MTRREKKPASAFQSLDDCSAALRRIALLDIELEKIQGECDWVIAAAKRDAERRAKSKAEVRRQLVNDLAAYCEEHKAELTAAGKTIEMTYGRVGWRMNPPELRIAKGVKVGGQKATWDSLVALVKEKLGAAYVRVKESVAKDEIKKAGFDDDELLAAGLAIEQRDEWFYEIDRARVAPAVIAGGSAAPAEERR